MRTTITGEWIPDGCTCGALNHQSCICDIAAAAGGRDDDADDPKLVR